MSRFSAYPSLSSPGATVEDTKAGNVGRGVAAWADAGGILGRGVLIDYGRWVSLIPLFVEKL